MEDQATDKLPLIKKHIITVAGRPGSGKSTAAKAAASRLGFKHFSSGDLYRQLADNQGVELLEANISADAHQIIDPLVDGKLREIGVKEDGIVIDSRMAWHWIPASFKVFLDLDIDTAARRILAEISEDRLKNEKVMDSPDDYAKVLRRRLDIETERYKAKYGIDLYEMANYDLLIHTAHNDPAQTVEKLVQGFKNWINT
jgi:cytidylate kinase